MLTVFCSRMIWRSNRQAAKAGLRGDALPAHVVHDAQAAAIVVAN
jgi:hypothetical protein